MMETLGRKHCLFLSHSSIDTVSARTLKALILSTEAARNAGLEVWLDADDLVPGVGNWQAQLEDALLRKATAFAVLVGTMGVQNWVEREVRLALTRATGANAIPFIPVLMADTVGKDALPPFAQQEQWVFDPLSDGDALTKLIAGTLSLSPSKTPILKEPFVGLQPMREVDAGRFFGRSEEILDLVTALKRDRLLAISADSGAGKSSLALAGLVPAFRGGAFADLGGRGPDNRAWHVVVMRPGADPLEGLRRGVTDVAERMGKSARERDELRERIALGNVERSSYAMRCDLTVNTTESLLVVDQFEELLIDTPEAERAPFVEFLVKLASLPEPGGFRVLLTIRADYFNLCKPFGTLYERLANADCPATFRLKRISDLGLVDAVKRPLVLAGYLDTWDAERLARRVTNDLGDRPGDLSLAQMALYTVWRERRQPDGKLIDAYVDVGGVSGALAHEAQQVLTRRLSKGEAALMIPLFIRLVQLGDIGGAVRRICLRSELELGRRQLADKLCSDQYGRLLLASQDGYEVCHEQLITQWPWLQLELNNVASDMRDFEPLMRRAAQWERSAEGDRAQHLATGAELVSSSDLAARWEAWLSPAERLFVESSQAAHQVELDLRAKEKLFRKRVRHGTRVALALFATIAVVAGWMAVEAGRANDLATKIYGIALSVVKIRYKRSPTACRWVPYFPMSLLKRIF
jgi:hypothetical protein